MARKIPEVSREAEVGEVLHKRAEIKKRVADFRAGLSQTFGRTIEKDRGEERAPRGHKYDPDIGAYDSRNPFDEEGNLVSHGPAEKYKDTPKSELDEVLQNVQDELSALINNGADKQEIIDKKSEIKGLEEFVKRAKMKPKSIFDPHNSKIRVYGDQSQWLQGQFVYMLRVEMPNGREETRWPLANTHYYHGRLYFGSPPATSYAEPRKKQADVRAVADDIGNVIVRNNVDDAVGSAIIVDSKNALVVYPQLPQTPLQKFVTSDRIVGMIRESAGEKRWDNVLWSEMMLSYNTAYWMTLFGRGPKTPEDWGEDGGTYDADHIFIKFIMDNVNINHEREDDIKKSIVARYMSLSSGYEIRDLKAYLAFNPMEEPEAEVSEDVGRSVSAVSEHVFSLEDEL